MKMKITCPNCEGTGVVLWEIPMPHCPTCAGTGWVEIEKEIPISLEQAAKQALAKFPEVPQILGNHFEPISQFVNHVSHMAWCETWGYAHRAACSLALCAKILHQVKCEHAQEMNEKPPLELYDWIWPAANDGISGGKHQAKLDFAWQLYEVAKGILTELADEPKKDEHP